jgi:hypothetical protein
MDEDEEGTRKKKKEKRNEQSEKEILTFVKFMFWGLGTRDRLLLWL